MAYRYAAILTGGIGTGKSTTASLLKLYGFPVICADDIAHRVLEEQKVQIAEYFGPECVSESGVDRKALGKIVFGNPEKRKLLESLVHPGVRENIQSESERLDERSVPHFIDIPLFFETGEYPVETVVVVYAPKSVQIERIRARDGLDEAEIENRLSAQTDIEEKKKKATHVIDNSGDLPHLQAECERVAALIKECLKDS